MLLTRYCTSCTSSSTSEAWQYFFIKICEYSALASASGRGKLKYKVFAQEWNQSADGKFCYYDTTEVFCAYVKTWEKFNTIQALQEMIFDRIELVCQSCDIFVAPQLPFPDFLTRTAVSLEHQQGVIDVDPPQPGPSSFSVKLPISHRPIM